MADSSAIAASNVFVKSDFNAEGQKKVKGFDWEGEVSLDSLAASMVSCGFQSTNVGLAIEQIWEMLRWRLKDRPILETDREEWRSDEAREKIGCTIFLSYTSNLISAGMRETILFLVKHKLIDVVVTTAGGIEEDFIKCLAPTYIGDFKLPGKDLRAKGINRIGNLIVPNENYCLFEDWIMPVIETMADEQEKDGVRWSPSKVIDRLGKEIDNEESVYYWAHKNKIPVFCPALTDGSIGDMLYFFSYKRPEFSLDIIQVAHLFLPSIPFIFPSSVLTPSRIFFRHSSFIFYSNFRLLVAACKLQDIRLLNDIAVRAPCSGMIILGGGIIKHHVCNANLMRNGADFSVFINTGHEFDGSDSGASPDEAVSWGKIRLTAKPVKVVAEATLVFPLIVSQTFYKYWKSQKN
jgi:deoxyhypusine synthase